MNQISTATVAFLNPDWNLVRQGVSPRIQVRATQVVARLADMLPTAKIATRHGFGGISTVVVCLNGKSSGVELQSTRGDIFFRAVDDLGEPLSDYECPVDRLSWDGPCAEVAAWLERT